MEWILNGTMGGFWVSLAFAAALTSAVALGFSLRPGPDSRLYERLGLYAFAAHGLAVVGIFFTLIGLILTHRYEYHYVWSHSSNELPLHFVVSCLWEGQEGSFLIWTFWHVLLGLVVWRFAPEWRAGVIAVVASVQMLLSSMLLGIHLPAASVAVLLGGSAALGTLYLWNIHQRISAILTGLIGVGCLLLVNAELATQPVIRYGVLAVGLGVLGYVVWLLRRQAPFGPVAVLAAVSALALGVLWAGPGGWSVGSSPFLLLKEAFPDAEAYQQDPNFVPLNGNGLNPLLQNYWMVIHPPTLFLGFAATLFPFAFLMAGLLRGQYSSWVRPAIGWSLFAGMILGVGIIMGGYWAYETLNFGGYWAWDPVENASLVPWITLVAGLHALLVFRRNRTGLHLASVLLAVSFLLILYSTFLTRSGILGDSSVHSFTDLGMSGQLLLLLLAYVLGTALLMAWRWNQLPSPKDAPEPGWLSAELYLLLGVLVLLFSALQVGLATSLPVFNKVLGTKLAPPAQVTLFYYKWNVWFGIGVAVLSGLGQFFYWRRMEKATVGRALFRPFLFAAVASLLVIVAVVLQEWDFAFHKPFRQVLNPADGNASLLDWITTTPLLFADDLLLVACFFSLFANLDMVIQLVRRNRSHLKRMGGALAHIGFALMLLGVLFSSGYERTVSVNFKPHLLGTAFPEESKQDNVLLIRDQPERILGYTVTYKGKKQAKAPLSDFRVVMREARVVKVAFRDVTGESFTQALPTELFDEIVKPKDGKGNSPNLIALKEVIEKNLGALQPKLLNNRSLYALEFQHMQDTARRFVLYPEAEVNENMGLVAHPDRKVNLNGDLYVHVTSIPNTEKDEERKRKEYELRAKMGDTLQLARSQVVVERVVRVTDAPEIADYSLAVRLKLKVLPRRGNEIFQGNPMLLVAEDGSMNHADSYVEGVETWFSFQGADPAKGQVLLKVSEMEERPDYLTFKAIYKPWINVLWLGTFVLAFGFLLALVRNVRQGQ